MVYDACSGLGDIEKKRIEERLTTIDEKLVSKNRPYDGNMPWLENAEAEHKRKPFHAIISRTNPREHQAVLLSEELDETNPLWAVHRETRIPRTPTAMSQAIAPLLSASTRIVFVDPNFGPEKARYRRTLEAFLSVAVLECPTITSIEFHLEEKATAEFFFQESRRLLPGIIPKGTRVRFVRWRQLTRGDELHPRYVMTERGGIRIDAGLDVGADGETTDVTLLEPTLYHQRWKQFQKNQLPEENAFEFVDEITIIGTQGD